MSLLKPITLTTFFVLLCFFFVGSEVTRKPYIGIISTPSDHPNLYDPKEFSYIKGSYAEFIEAGNGIPVAIPWDLPIRELINVLNSVNGILFTGGDASLWEHDNETNEVVFNEFTKRTTFILKYAMMLNDQGIHFPVYGICQGHEVITMGIAGTPTVIDHYTHPGQLDTVTITPKGQRSRMFGSIPDHLISFLAERRSMFYNHRLGFNLSLLEENEILNDFFILTATGKDDKGKEFIGGLEAKEYPIFTVQYHPERVLSEWNNKTFFDHPEEAAEAIIIKAQAFLSEALKNNQQFYNLDTKERYLIRNHRGVYIDKVWPNTYFYDKKSPISYHVDPDWSEYSDVDSYNCEEHDCSFILEQL